MTYQYVLLSEFYTGVKRPLSSTTLSSSTLTVKPRATRPLALSASASSTASATFASRKRALAEATSSAGKTTATLGRRRPLTAAGASASATSVALHGAHALTSASGASGASAATIHRSRALASGTSASGAVSATIHALHPGLNLLVSGVTETAADIARSRAIAALGSVSGSNVATIHAVHVLAATLGSVGVLAAAPARTRPLTAAGASSSLFFAENGRARLLQVASTSESFAVLGFLIRSQPLESDAASRLLGIVRLGAGRGLFVNAGSISQLSSSPQRPRAFAATSAGASVVTIGLLRGRHIAASGASGSALLAVLVKPRRVFIVVPGRRVAIPVAGRVTIVPSEQAEMSGVTTTAFDQMDPADIDFFTFDWSSRAATDSIVSAVVTSSPPADLTIGGLTVAPTSVQVTCSAGPACGESIGLKCAVVLQSGRNLSWTARLPVAPL